MPAINVIRDDVETLFVRIELTGLAAGTRYDVMRLQLRYSGNNAAGQRQYARELPDRRGLWSSVAHRVGWAAPGGSATFRDYECPKRPTQYFLVETSKVGPFEHDFANGNYPLGRGVLSPQIIHFNQDIRDLALDEEPDKGHVLVRSVHELAHYADCCLVEMDGPTYTARVNEFAVMGSQYPVIVSDSREARRGSMTLLTRTLSQYNALRRVVFPESGRIRPFVVNSGGDQAMLLDDLRAIALDVEIEQATPRNAGLRFVTIEYVEIDPSAPLIARSGDNDTLTNAPVADFAFSDATPSLGQWVTLFDHSTGQGDTWEFVVGDHTSNRMGIFYGPGPHQLRFLTKGKHAVKLRFGGSGQGFHTRTKTVQVG